MREEFVLARMALRGGSAVSHQPQAIGAGLTHDRPDLKDLDNESKELLLVGEFQALVAAAGHIPRMLSNSDWGIDGEIEFKDALGNASGKRVYVQLKSGDSHLVHRRRDNVEVHRLTNLRHAQYWRQQAYPVMLVVRKSDGSVRWMNVSKYLEKHSSSNGDGVREIIFEGEAFAVENIKRVGDQQLGSSPEKE
jgi:hypothetical protein